MGVSKFIAIIAVSVLTTGTALAAGDYPSKPVKLVVPFPPGGSVDLQARLLATLAKPEFPQTFYVENVSGAGGAVAAAQVARSAPDGYTLLVSNNATGTFKPLSERLPYSMNSFIPICQISAGPAIFAVNAESPYKTLSDFIAAAKAKPGTLKYSSAGIYSAGQVPTVLFARKADIKLVHIPYSGGSPALTALLGSHVDLNASFPSIFASPIQAGLIRPLAVASSRRLTAFPELKTLKELGYDVESYQWIAVLTPAGTPQAVVTELRSVCKATVAKSEFAKSLEKMGDETAYLDGPEFSSYWKKEWNEIDALFKTTKMQ